MLASKDIPSESVAGFLQSLPASQRLTLPGMETKPKSAEPEELSKVCAIGRYIG
jgi:hypothetical protein